MELEQIELIRKKTGLSYEQARDLLVEAGGDVVEALILHERRSQPLGERIQVRGEELVRKFRELIQEGNVTRIRIRHEDRVLMDIPVTAAVIGVALAPLLGAVGLVAAMVTETSIEVERTKQAGDEQE